MKAAGGTIMGRNSIIFLLLASILLLSSCSKVGGGMISDDSDKKADKRMKQILETLKDEDQEALKAMFSKQALEEADDFDDNLDYLFKFLQGNVDSWARDRFDSEGSI